MAGTLYILMQTDGWKSDNAYANSILSMADGNLTNAGLNDLYASYMNTGCSPQTTVAMDDIASAAVSWAWPQGTTWYDINDESTMDGGGNCYKMTKCTTLYLAVKSYIAKTSDPYYSSCDRGVYTAVRASGADADFPLGNANSQLMYATASDKWENLGPVRSMDMLNSLEPGDLLLSSGHVMVFVGPDEPLKKWSSGAGSLTDCTYAVVHSSRSSELASSRGPRCDNDCQWILTDSKMWYAFRCKSYTDLSTKTMVETYLSGKNYYDGSEEWSDIWDKFNVSALD
jgi:hypothetical protein